jgi:hypothetical protein
MLSPSFTKVLNATKSANAQHELGEIIGVQLRKYQASMNHLDAVTNFKVGKIDRKFPTAMQNYSIIMTPINQDPMFISTKLSIVSLCRSPTSFMVFQDHSVNCKQV